MVTQSDIARRVGLDVSSVNKILNQRPGPVFRKETIKKVLQAARQLGFKFDRLKHQHRRSHDRKPTRETVEISVFKSDGAPHDRGQAVLEDISPVGARLGHVSLPSNTIPLGPVVVSIQRKGDSAPKRGQLVRVVPSNGTASMGITFIL